MGGAVYDKKAPVQTLHTYTLAPLDSIINLTGSRGGSWEDHHLFSVVLLALVVFETPTLSVTNGV